MHAVCLILAMLLLVLLFITNKKSAYLATIDFGGDDITQDIAKVFSLPLSVAEKCKIMYGDCMYRSSDILLLQD